MKTIASLAAGIAVELSQRLAAATVPFEVRTTTQDGGVEQSELLVAETDYDRACDVAEAWDAEKRAEAERRATRHCPRCGSVRLEYGNADSFSRNIWHCNDCGNDFAQ